jgi:hypothetical protein
MLIIYPSGDTISVIRPTGEISVQEVAKKDVPKDVPYLIIQESDLPEDKTFRSAWEADFTVSDGYGIGHTAWQIEKYEEVVFSNTQEITTKNTSLQYLLSEIEEVETYLGSFDLENLNDLDKETVEIQKTRLAALSIEKSRVQSEIENLTKEVQQRLDLTNQLQEQQ